MNSLLHIHTAKADYLQQPAVRHFLAARIEGAQLMRRFDRVAPAGTRFARRVPEALLTVPVVRELPRPIPQGFGSTAW